MNASTKPVARMEWVAMDNGFPVGNGRTCDEALTDAKSAGFAVTSVVRRLSDHPNTHVAEFAVR